MIIITIISNQLSQLTVSYSILTTFPSFIIKVNVLMSPHVVLKYWSIFCLLNCILSTVFEKTLFYYFESIKVFLPSEVKNTNDLKGFDEEMLMVI